MLSVVARFGASGGMVTVPNLVGQTQSEANATIIAAGLTIGSVTTGSTSSSGSDNRVSTQTLTASSLVNYGSALGYQYLIYTAPAPTIVITYGPYEVTNTYKQFLSCDTATKQSKYAIVTSYRRQIFANGVATGTYYEPPSDTQIVPEYVDGQCGYYVEKCSVSSTSSDGACSSGFFTRTYQHSIVCTTNGVVTYSGGLGTTQEQVACCSTVSSVASGTYGSCICLQKCRDKSVTTNCGGVITTTTIPGGWCVSCTTSKIC